MEQVNSQRPLEKLTCIILAGGKGTRLQSVVSDVPKPMAPIGGTPFIELLIDQLVRQGVRHIVLSVGYKRESIIGYFQKNIWSGLTIDFVEETTPLGTGGAIKFAAQSFPAANYLVLNGDIFTDYDFPDNRKLPEGILAHIILVPNPEHNPEGDFALDGQRVIDNKQYTFSGIGYYSPKLFEGVLYGKSGLAPLLRQAMKEGKVTGELYEGEWLDIGTPERLERLNAELMNRY